MGVCKWEHITLANVFRRTVCDWYRYDCVRPIRTYVCVPAPKSQSTAATLKTRPGSPRARAHQHRYDIAKRLSAFTRSRARKDIRHTRWQLRSYTDPSKSYAIWLIICFRAVCHGTARHVCVPAGNFIISVAGPHRTSSLACATVGVCVWGYPVRKSNSNVQSVIR